jgi:hypothetical protein
MPNSPLFPNFNKLIREQQAALRQWAKAQQSKAPRSGQPTRYSSRRTPTGRAGGNWLWNTVLSKFGDIGSIIDSMLRPNGQQLAPDIAKEIEAAQNLLAAFGYDVNKPEQVPEIVRELVPESEVPKEVQPKEMLVDTRRKENALEEEPEQIDSGKPLTEGMIPVRSSNVESIGFEWPEHGTVGNLLVRFLGGDSKHRAGKGPLYRYFDVDRSVFDAFKRAASKGSFVWSSLRIRGTVSGHQYAYELAGTGPDDYIPRQAGLKRGQKGEFFLPRTFKGRKSSLPEEKLRGIRSNLVDNFRGKASKLNFRKN